MNTTPIIEVLVVDDHPLLREGVTAMLEQQSDMRVVGEAANGAEAIDMFRRLKPDVVLMDLQMPQMSGQQAIETIRKDAPNAKIIVLTTYSGDVQALRALRAGATAYILKSSLRHELVDAIRAVNAGRRHVPSTVATEIALHASGEHLTEREIRVLEFVSLGHANKEIARELAVSEDTVKGQLKSIFAKLGVSDRTRAVTLAVKRGIIQL